MIPIALSYTKLITFGFGAFVAFAISPLTSVYFADDEVCLGQLQALRLGQE